MDSVDYGDATFLHLRDIYHVSSNYVLRAGKKGVRTSEMLRVSAISNWRGIPEQLGFWRMANFRGFSVAF